MKVLVIGNQARSVANFWTVLMQNLVAKNHEVICCVPHGTDEEEAKLKSCASRVVFYFIARKSLNPLHDFKTYLDLYRLFKAEAPDIVFSTTIKPVIYGGFAARFCSKIKYYATITGLGFAFEQNSFLKRILHWFVVSLYRLALKSAAGIFFQNRDDLAVFQEEKILDPKVSVFMAKGTGVDTKHFGVSPWPEISKECPMVFLFVGRLLEAKGLFELAKASRYLKQKNLPFKLQLLGPLEEGLGGVKLSEIQAWEHEGLVEYLGATSDVRSYLEHCHVLVLPSWREGLPTAAMEALSCGRMCLLTDVPGCREVIRPGENGLLVPSKDPEALSRAMEECILHPEMVVQMGEAGGKIARLEFDAQVVAQKIMADMQI